MADEARLNELLDIYEQALAEGDAATAEKVKAAYRKESGAEELSVPSALKQAAAMHFRPMVEGVKGLAAGELRTLAAPGRLVTAGAEAAGVPGASVKKYNEGVQDLEARIGASKVAAGVGEFVAGMAIPVSRAAKITGYWKAIKEGAKTGAVFGSIFGAGPETETPEQVAVGTAIGAGAGTVAGGALGGMFAAAPSLLNQITRLFKKPVPAAAKNIKRMRASTLTRDIPLTAGQETGSPVLIALEQRAGGRFAQDFQNKQLEEFAHAADVLANRANRVTPGASATAAAAKTSAAYNQVTARMQREGSRAYGQGLDRVMKMAGADAEQFPVPFDHFSAAMDDAIVSIGAAGAKPSSWFKWLSPETLKANPQLQEAANYLARVRATGGTGLSVPEIVRLKRAANTLRRGVFVRKDQATGAQLEQYRLGKNIADAVDADVAAFLGNAKLPVVPGQQTGARAALHELEAVNQQYGAFKQAMDSHRQQYIAKAFRGGIPANPAAAFDTLFRMERVQQRNAVKILNEVAPEVIGEIKAWKMTEAAASLRTQIRAGNAAAIDPAQFVRSMTNGDELFGAMLWNKAERKELQSAVAAARTILTDHTLSPLAAEPARVLAAGVTRNAAFVAMNLYNIALRGMFERVLWTKEGIKALHTLRSTYKQPTRATIQALSTLDLLTRSPDEEQPQ